MEYEISDVERLFDDSTNPSLLPENRTAQHSVGSAKPQADPADKRKLQKAELIPEEEHQLA
jgi:hypothetical protein